MSGYEIGLTPALPGEFGAVRGFYWDLIDAMRGRTDTVGWKKGIYPADDFLLGGLRRGELYVLRRADGYAASVVLNSECNEGYAGVLWGCACAPDEVLIPHALGVRADLQGQGVGYAVVRDILAIAEAEKKRTVRLDILGGNRAAERLYTKAGFRFVQAKQMFYEDTGWTEFKMFERIL